MAGGALVSLLASTGVARADVIANDADATVDAAAESLSLALGSPASSVGLRVITANGDGKNGCNLTGSTTLVVDVVSSNPAVATARSASPTDPTHPERISFVSCGDTPVITVTPVGVGTSTISLAVQTNSTGGTFDLAPATFTVGVSSSCAAVPTAAPTVTMTTAPSPSGWYNAGSGPATFTVAPAGNAEYSLDGGGTWAAYGAAVTIPSDGSFEVRARNVRPASTGCAFVAGPASDATPVRIDRALPTLTGVTSPALANDAGWNQVPVSVDWTCGDTGGSGVDTTTCPADESYGDGQSALAAEVVVRDLAGNTSLPAARRAIDVDTTAPTLTVGVTAPNGAGWNNTLVTAAWTCTDLGSGFDSPSPCPTDESFGEDDSPVAERTVTVTDLAGNSTTTTRRSIRIDETAPSITAVVTPDADSAGWNNGPVDAEWTCSGGASGLAPATPCPDDERFTAEGAYPARTASVDDVAGNTSAVATRRAVKIDTTPPTVSVSILDAEGEPIAANGNGWFAEAVTVRFECADPVSGGVRSGVAGGGFACPGDIELSTDGTHTGVAYEVRDVAGNAATGTSPDVRIDTTAPVLGVTVTPPANAAGWNSSTVTVAWTCTEEGSGIAGACPAGSTHGDGTDLPAATGVTVTDLAGNTSNAVDRRAVRVDTVAPVLALALSPLAANAAGWNNASVTADWTCTDAPGSGVDASTCPADVTYGHGTNEPVAVLTVTDVAGNISAPVERRAVKVDTEAPDLSVVVGPGANAAGWNNSAVTADWTCEDAVAGFADPDPCPTDEGFTEGVTAERSVTVTDLAGNSATALRRAVRIDATTPSIVVAVVPDATGGWNNGPVAADWTCADGGGSGLAASPACPADETFTAEGSYPAQTATVRDVADNPSAPATRRQVDIDLTAPTVTVELRGAGGEVIAPNAAGWFAQPVTVHVECSDPVSGGVRSGVSTGAYGCPADQQLTQGVHPGHGLEVRDVAGNAQTSVSVPAIRIDTTAPVASVLGATNGGTHVVGAAPTPSCSTSDDGGSGVATDATLTVVGTPDASGAGAFTATCSGAVDAAGNTSSPATVAYTVGYRFLGFFQPINDPAGASPSVFRQGSTIPVKFALADARGNRIPDAAAQAIADACSATLITNRLTGQQSAVNETVSTSAASTGTCFRYDAAADQFVFNLNTKGLATSNYRLTASIGVGSATVTAHDVVVGLR